jgi:hypothetical protein
LPFLIFVILLYGCNKKEDTKITVPPEGCIKLSELETKQDYYLPFAIVNDSNDISAVILNDSIFNFPEGGFIEFKENGFYELILIYNDLQKPNDTLLFTTKTEEREFSEWGIKAWVPAPFKTAELGSEEIEMYYPHRFTDHIKVPFIFYIKEAGLVKDIFCQGACPADGSTFYIKEGEGSVNIDASLISNEVAFTIGGRQINVSVDKISESDMELQGTISSDIDIPTNSLVKITGDLDIASTGSLTVHEGSTIVVNEAVDINVSGPIVFSGTANNPIFVTCSDKDKFWGGFITRVAGGSVEAQYTIFCQSGYHASGNYGWGHSGRQALFYTEKSSLTLDHCFMLDHIGQVFYPQYATLVFDNILVQRVQTGGQINYSDLTLRNSVFTDFPDDSPVFEDKDNDALYLSASDAEIDNTVFMYAKDDGLDSGNEQGGEITVTNCRFEACFHEGAALSSGNGAVKHHNFIGCVFFNCGQGLELGFSSPNHLVVADNCMFLNNGIGIRYGDNYDWSHVDGEMIIKNSSSLNNDKDVWNMVRIIWAPKLENLSFENTVVSKFCPQYPGLEVKPK